MPIAIAMLVVIGLALTLSPVVYKTLEKVEFVKIAAVLIFLAVALVAAITGDAYSDVAEDRHRRIVGRRASRCRSCSARSPSRASAAPTTSSSPTGSATRASAWARTSRTSSRPITGEDQAKPSTGYMVRQDKENLDRFWGWWRVANKEQFFVFFCIGLTTIFVFSLLAYSTVYGKDLGEDLDFIRGEGELLGASVGPWFKTMFWLIGAVSLFGGFLALLDYIARLSADAIKTIHARESTKWTESKLYFCFVWTEIILGTCILLSGFDQPLTLLIIASSLNGVVMFIYSLLLIKLNRQALPEPLRLRGWRLGLMWMISAVFGTLSVALLISQI